MLTSPGCFRGQDGGAVLAGVPHECNAEASQPVASFEGRGIAWVKNTPDQTMSQGAGVTEHARGMKRGVVHFTSLGYLPPIHRPMWMQ